MRAALVQFTAGDDPAANLARLRPLLAEAAARGAGLVCTPEMTNCLAPREVLLARAQEEGADPVLAGLREEARRHGVWIAAGSLALRLPGEARLANRSVLIGPDGEIAARYDKIHLFDVDLSPAETWRESEGFRPGSRAVLARTPLAALGLTICYDLRFAHLHRALAQAGAEVILSPAAFTRPTGEAHWEVLLRARAIETGSFLLAAAQTGEHGSGRRTHGHSLAVGPWGEVLLDMGREEGVGVVDLDPGAVAEARRRLPSLRHDRPFEGP
ncbi:carbon-nitrogen hydrolase family protein [Rubellimicrobium sp. CFH 75288]|uniref:carbon-nitrogen hydrolase family protein n=1 Tax=Rubellimicrobium sp. CFH 75288 TaxID=2697034 RepID=UPI0014126857|nr:carbon-nitrogen hydrolase family protein [Rubellimicrobium sp. CFH 75288]NAZ37743.1 carbon-nitrogen hydrolase family protein [Rubellimicrobium sp. CFH 75288]